MSSLKPEFFVVVGLLMAFEMTLSAGPLSAEESAESEDASAEESASTEETTSEDDLYDDEEDMGEDPNEFFRNVASAGTATISQGMRICYILMTGNQLSVSFERVRSYLLTHRVITRSWLDHDEDDYITFGEISYLVAGAVDISGGVMYTLTDWIGFRNMRYAHRELMFRGIVPTSNDNQYVRGVELLTIMQRASEYIEARKVDQELSGVVEEAESSGQTEEESTEEESG